MHVTQEIVEKYIDKWQDMLRLRDWDIRVQIVSTPWRKSGDVKIDLDDKKAVMLISQAPKSENLEELVVHELLHIKLYGLDQMTEQLINILFGAIPDDPRREFAITQFFVLLESTVEDLTKGYLAANGAKEPLSFGRLRRQINEELDTGR
jgi:hypothetical protein